MKKRNLLFLFVLLISGTLHVAGQNDTIQDDSSEWVFEGDVTVGYDPVENEGWPVTPKGETVMALWIVDEHSATYTFTGTGVEVWGWKYPVEDGAGTGSILIDGVALSETPFNWDTTEFALVKIADSGPLDEGSHTVKIIPLAGNADDWINVDFIVVRSSSAEGGLLTITDNPSMDAVTIPDDVTDWVHWGTDTVRKATGGNLIGDYQVVGDTPDGVFYGNDLRAISWTGGDIVETGDMNTEGLFFGGDPNPELTIGQGVSFTLPAGTGLSAFTLYCGGWNSGGKITASLSDGSAPDISDSTELNPDQWDQAFTITYKAASDDQTLTVNFITNSAGEWGNVAIQAATLSVNIPEPSVNLYMVGDASPADWDISAPTPMVQDENNPDVFTWNGILDAGELKFPFFTDDFNDWCAGDWINAPVNQQSIAEASTFLLTHNCEGPDNKWRVSEAEGGIEYWIRIDLEAGTIVISDEVLSSVRKTIVNDLFKVYPNPGNGDYLGISLNNKESGSLVNIRITDVTGRELFNKNVEGQEIRLNNLSLPKGMNFITVSDKNNTQSLKFIVK